MNPEHDDITGRSILETIKKAESFNRWLFSRIRPYIQGQTLEIGSGIGNISDLLLKENIPVTLSDTDPYYISYLKNHYEQNSNLKNVYAIDLNENGFTEKLSTLKESFDTIVAINVLEHIESDKLAIENMMYLLKPGGSIIILTPAYSGLYSQLDKALGHFRRYSKKQLTGLFSDPGLKIKNVSFFNALGTIAWSYAKLRRLKNIPATEMKLFNLMVPAGKLLDRLVFRKYGLSLVIVGQKI